MANLGISSPWVVYYRKVEAFFKHDKDVHVVYDNDTRSLRLYVENAKKAVALSGLLPTKKRFGKIDLKIAVIPSNTEEFYNEEECDSLIAFENNEAVSFIRKIAGIFAKDLSYVVFKKEVVQYFTDDLSDYYGIHSTLYEDLARDIFGDIPGVYFSTDVADSKKLSKPLGEWP